MTESLLIRPVSENDAAALLFIYEPYVRETAVTFETSVPTVQEFQERIRKITAFYPYLAAEMDGQIVGFAYANLFHERDAYNWAVETSLYVDRKMRHEGIGGALHAALLSVLKEQGFLNMNACIASPAGDDPYLNRDSILFHEHLGYRLVGEFHQCGYKFDRWYNMVWMEKMIGKHHTNQPAVLPFSSLSTDLLRRCLATPFSTDAKDL